MKCLIDRTVFGLLLVASSLRSYAFDTETHALITKQAYDQSVLADTPQGNSSTTVQQLGLDRFDESTRFNLYWLSPLLRVPVYYLDGKGPAGGAVFSPQGPEVRPESFERCQMREFRTGNNTPTKFQIFSDTVDLDSLFLTSDSILPIQNWVVRGAIREDDIGSLTLFSPSGIHCWSWSLLEQHGSDVRSLNHFYDPYLDAGLGQTLIGTGIKSVDWALGYVNSFATPQTLDPNRGNLFSYADARNLFWWALTREIGGDQSRANSKAYNAALRESDAEDRLSLWATTFRSLGNVAHLLQDTGQPQHTRNDPHSFMNTPEQKAFEDYTNDRVLGLNTGENDYLKGFFGTLPGSFTPPPLGAYQPMMFSTPLRFFTTRNPGGDDAQSLRAGLADYTNRGFFTGGTHPILGAMKDPSPPAPIDAGGNLINGYNIESASCLGLLNGDARLAYSVTCEHYTRDVPDKVQAYSDDLCSAQSPSICFSHPPLLSDGVLHQVVVNAQSELQGSVTDYYQFLTAIGIEEMDITGNMTIPRAVAYSTGMFNYFFRGQLKLSSPPDGLYAVLDHGTPHQLMSGGDAIPVMSSDGTTAFGFTSVRVRVKNNTMVDANGNDTLIDAGTKSPVPQTMKTGTGPDGKPNGYLVAIARYHRNPCYQPNLSGEASYQPPATTSSAHVPAGCTTTAQLRTAFQEISVSAPINLDQNGNLPGPNSGDSQQGVCDNLGNINSGVAAANNIPNSCVNSSALMRFNFSGDPIPVNATDLFLQVAYRGQLGQETDGIAVGVVDLMEPAYMTAATSADVTWDTTNKTFVPSTPEYRAAHVINSLSMCLGQQKIGSLNTQQTLGATELVRLAVLTDQPSFQTATVSKEVGNSTPAVIRVNSGGLALVRQSDKENGGVYLDSSMLYGRGFTFTTLSVLATTFPQGADPDAQTAWNQYFALTPAVGASSPGLATPIAAQFTGMPDDECKQYNPAQAISPLIRTQSVGDGDGAAMARGYGVAQPSPSSL